MLCHKTEIKRNAFYEHLLCKNVNVKRFCPVSFIKKQHNNPECKWCTYNNMALRPQKTKCMVIGSKQTHRGDNH